MSLQNELVAVEKAVTRAINLVQKFADQDPADETSCWQNPTLMYEQLDAARDAAMAAWKRLEQAQQQHDDKEGATTVVSFTEQDLRAQFMDMVTDAFADVLAEMKDTENIDLDVLVDCLQSGMEILSQEDKELFMMDYNDAVEQESGSMTPHEERRQELGFQRVETTA